MDLNLKGKVILVTGGAAALARQFVARAAGLAVPVILDRARGCGPPTAIETTGRGIISEVIVVELTELSDVRTASKRSATNWSDRWRCKIGNQRRCWVGARQSGRVCCVAQTESRPLLCGHASGFFRFSRGRRKRCKHKFKVAVTGQGGTSGYACGEGAIWDSRSNGRRNCQATVSA